MRPDESVLKTPESAVSLGVSAADVDTGPKIRRRLNQGLLRPLEQAALQWLAARVPCGIVPDHLTLLGVAGSIVVFLGYVLCQFNAAFLWLASAGIVVNWLGDSLDGTLARYRGIERPRYGLFVDHATDLLSEVMFALGLGLSSYIRFDISCLALIAYLLMATFTFLRVLTSGVLQIAFAGIGPTEVRLGMIILNLIMFFVPPRPVIVLWAPLSAFDLLVLVSAGATFLYFLGAILREARRLALEDPSPAHRPTQRSGAAR